MLLYRTDPIVHESFLRHSGPFRRAGSPGSRAGKDARRHSRLGSLGWSAGLNPARWRKGVPERSQGRLKTGAPVARGSPARLAPKDNPMGFALTTRQFDTAKRPGCPRSGGGRHLRVTFAPR